MLFSRYFVWIAWIVGVILFTYLSWQSNSSVPILYDNIANYFWLGGLFLAPVIDEIRTRENKWFKKILISLLIFVLMIPLVFIANLARLMVE